MTKTLYVTARVTPEERRRIEDLAERANTTPSEVLRALLRAAVDVRPVQATVQDWTQPGADHAAVQQA